MAIRNYRQAKRSREETRKKRQHQKLERKLSRTAPAPEGTDTTTPPAGTETKEAT